MQHIGTLLLIILVSVIAVMFINQGPIGVIALFLIVFGPQLIPKNSTPKRSSTTSSTVCTTPVSNHNNDTKQEPRIFDGKLIGLMLFSILGFILILILGYPRSSDSATSDNNDSEYISNPTSSSISVSAYPTYETFPSITLPEAPSIDPKVWDSFESVKIGGSIQFTSYSEKVRPGGTGRVAIKGKPNTQYTIKVMYSSGPSSASTLYPKKSDSKGNVSWSWRIGSNTYSGTYTITVTGGGSTASVEFEVT